MTALRVVGGSPIADHFPLRVQRKVIKGKDALVSRHCHGIPALLVKAGGCATRAPSSHPICTRACAVGGMAGLYATRPVLAEIPGLDCDCSAVHKGDYLGRLVVRRPLSAWMRRKPIPNRPLIRMAKRGRGAGSRIQDSGFERKSYRIHSCHRCAPRHRMASGPL